MLYERRHTRDIAEFGGVSTPMPVLATFFMIVTLSSIGLPGLNGFVGEFLVLSGAFRSSVLLATIATAGVVLAAYYMLWMFQRVMFGKVANPANRTLRDLSPREVMVLVPLVAFILWIGIYPKTFLGRTEASVNHVVTSVREAASLGGDGGGRLEGGASRFAPPAARGGRGEPAPARARTRGPVAAAHTEEGRR
jgi:NADH-quinone oxidoreductase subunit M